MRSIIETLALRAELHPERDALIAGNRRVTYGELWARVQTAAQGLIGFGVLPRDRVLLAAPGIPAFVYGYFAVHLIGAVAVPLDPLMPKMRRDELIERTSPKLVFGMQAELHPKMGRIHAIVDLESQPMRQVALDPPSFDSLSDLVFTTGTTGKPKGVCLTHRNLAVAAQNINTVIGSREGDVEVMPLPLNHSFGLGRLRCNLLAGGTIVLVEGFRLPGEIFAAIEQHQATGLVGVPAGFAVLLRFGARGLGSFARQLRYVELGSAPMPMEHKQALMELLPKTELWMHYGLTEASRSVFLEFHRHNKQLDSVGITAPGVQLSVRADDGSACARGQAGLLWISGPHVSPGYWDAPELTATTFVDGWVCTGDVAHLDNMGFVHLHGRKDDMINVGGFNVSPDEVEKVLNDHPSVREAACIGVSDPRGIAGQIVRAYLVAHAVERRETEAALSQWVGERLEPYKIPTQYRWVETLPRTASGKLLRAALRNAV